MIWIVFILKLKPILFKLSDNHKALHLESGLSYYPFGIFIILSNLILSFFPPFCLVIVGRKMLESLGLIAPYEVGKFEISICISDGITSLCCSWERILRSWLPNTILLMFKHLVLVEDGPWIDFLSKTPFWSFIGLGFLSDTYLK